MTHAPLKGLKVLDLSSGPAAGLATMILGDFGAHVFRVEDPDFAELNHQNASRMWLRGKQISEGAPVDLARDCDVLVISKPNGHPEISFETASANNSGIIYAEVTAFGDLLPEASNIPISEPMVAAKMGRMHAMSSITSEPGPKYSAVQVATHASAHNLVAGILAALFERARSGLGQRVSTSIVHGLMPYDQPGSLMLQVAPPPPPRPKGGKPPLGAGMPTLNYHPVQCKDGRWLQLGNLLPHLFVNFMKATELDHLIDEVANNQEMVRDAILSKMQERTADEWMAHFIADGGVAGHPYQTAEDALDDPDMIDNGHVVELEGVKQLGPFANLTGTPAEIGGKRDDKDTWPLVTPQASENTDAPLSGIKVVELATIIASPLGASFLSDLGARVIKVETIGGDPFRAMGGGYGALRCNQGKESIGVDLKSSEGQSLVHELIRDADIVIHNFRPGVPERLAIDYKTLSAINPELIYVSANGYGPFGPGALRPSTHPIPGAAMGGAGYQAGGVPTDGLLDNEGLRAASKRLMRANEVNPDPNTAVVVFSSALMGLMARETTGHGQQIFVDMFAANAYANFDDFVAFDGKIQRPALDAALRGPTPLSRIYACQNDTWIYLGIQRETDWEKFCQHTDSSLLDRFPRALASLDADLSIALSALFQTQDADIWEEQLLGANIGCVRADQHSLSEAFFAECRENSPLMTRVQHATLGDYYRHQPMVNFSRSQLSVDAAIPGGHHSRELAIEAGLSQTQVDEFFERGLLWSE